VNEDVNNIAQNKSKHSELSELAVTPSGLKTEH